MSTPSIIERITYSMEQLISAYEDDEYVHQKLMEIHRLFIERFFSNAFDMLQDLKKQITPTDPELYTLLENDISRVVKAKNKVKHDKQVALGQQLDVIAPSLKEEPKKVEEPEPKKRKKSDPNEVMDTFRPSQLKLGHEYLVTLVNKDSVHRKEKKMKKAYIMLDNGPQIWTLQNMGAVYYTFDTKGSIDSLGSNISIEDVTLEEVVLKPVPDPPELLDGMLIQVKWDGYPLLTQMYRNVVYAESPIVFVTYNTRTPIGNEPFNPTDPDEQWNYPEYIDLNNVTEIEVLDCGQYADEIKPLKPAKGSKVNVCVAKLNTGEVRVLVPDELSNEDLSRSFDTVAAQEKIISTDFVECRVIKVGKTTCTLEKYGEVPLGCILGVWREADVGETFESATEGSTDGVTPHLWNCEWKKNKKKFVLDLYYTEIRLPEPKSIEKTWIASLSDDEEQDDDALEEGETYEYGGIEYVCEGEASGEQKTDETVYVLKNKRLETTIYKTAQEIYDQVPPKFELFDKHAQQYVLFENKLWKVIDFNGHDRTYILEHDDGETRRAHEKDLVPKPVLSYEVGQLVGHNYEFCKVSDDEVTYTLVHLDQTSDDFRSTEAESDKYSTGITELSLDEWCMYKKKIVRLKLEDGQSVIEEKPDKKGKTIKYVKIYESSKKKRPTTVKKSLITFQPDIDATFVQEGWQGTLKKSSLVNVEVKKDEMKKGVIIGWRESDKAEHATSDKYEIRFDDGTKGWYRLQKIELISEVVEAVEESEETDDAYNAPSDSSSSSDSDSDSDHELTVEDEFDGTFVQIVPVAPLGLSGERVRDGDDEKTWIIVRDVTADDLGVKKLQGDQLDIYVIENGAEKEMMHREDLIKIIDELEGVKLRKGEVFQAVLNGGSYKLTSCWRDFEISVPSMCLVFYEPDIVSGKFVYLLADETYEKHTVLTTDDGLYKLENGLLVNRTQIDVYIDPFKKSDTVRLKGNCYEVFKVIKVRGRQVDLESTWDSSKKIGSVDMSNVSHSTEEYDGDDFVKVKETGEVHKVSKSVNNRVSLVGIKHRTFSPSEISPSYDPSTKESSDIEDNESGSESGSDN